MMSEDSKQIGERRESESRRIVYYNKKRDHPEVISSPERKTRLELATPTLARLCSTN